MSNKHYPSVIWNILVEIPQHMRQWAKRTVEWHIIAQAETKGFREMAANQEKSALRAEWARVAGRQVHIEETHGITGITYSITTYTLSEARLLTMLEEAYRAGQESVAVPLIPPFPILTKDDPVIAGFKEIIEDVSRVHKDHVQVRLNDTGIETLAKALALLEAFTKP